MSLIKRIVKRARQLRGASEVRRFTIDVEMQERWIPHFLGMLRYMEHLGAIGSSRSVTLFADGDGDFRPIFRWMIDVDVAEPIKDENGDRFYDAG